MPLNSADREANANATHYYKHYETLGDAAHDAGDWAAAKSAYEAAKRNRELSYNLHVVNNVSDPGNHVGAIQYLQSRINACQTHLNTIAAAAVEAARIAALAIAEAARMKALAATGSQWGRSPKS